MTDGDAGRRRIVRLASIRPAPDGGVIDADFFIRQSLIAGGEVRRRGRTWRMGQPHHEEPRHFGRLGYEATTETVAVWDNSAGDWRSETVPRGAAYPFAIDTERMLVAFDAPENSGFLSALQALMNSGPYSRWVLQQLRAEQLPFIEWRRRVSKVTYVSFQLHQPNPDWVGRERVRAIVEGAAAETVKLAYAAPDDGPGLDVDDELVRQAVAHAERYGAIKARGEVEAPGEVREVQYNSAPGSQFVTAEVEVGDNETVPDSVLSQVVATVDVGDVLAGDGDDGSDE